MPLFDTYFTPNQFLLLVSSVLLYFSSIIFFVFKKQEIFSIVFLLIAAFVLGVFAISLDPYLNMWDEQFHALVAKNLTKDFFKPTLYPDPVLPYDEGSWTENYIWLHKQPLFLWQMAISIKIFGATTFAIRFPGLLCFTFATFCTYKIGKNIANHKIGYLGALLFSSNYFFTELISGAAPTDQNDIVFISYVTASLWAFTEYTLNPEKKKWIWVIGIFSGAALLTKWLPGLLVYAAWFIYLFTEKKDRFNLNKYKQLIYSLGIAFIIFIPWQIYIWNVFPTEAALENKNSALHFNEALEGHSGDSWYYFDSLNRTMGRLFVLLCTIGVSFLNRFTLRRVYITFISLIILVFGFYTLASTKMDAFPLICSGLLFISIASLIEYFSLQFKKPTYQKPLLLFICLIGLFINLDPERIQRKHTLWKEDYTDYYERINRTEWKNFCDSLKLKSSVFKLVIFNCPETYENISLMYYTDFIGYQTLPTKENISLAKEKGYVVAVVDDGTLSKEITDNKNLTVLSRPQYKWLKTDTVYIRNQKNGYLSMFGEQLACTDTTPTEKFIIKYFADGTCCIQNSKGAIATLDSDWRGRILFKKKRFTARERFKIEQIQDSKYKIRTADDGTTLQVVNSGNSVCADDRPYLHDDEFEIIKKN